MADMESGAKSFLDIHRTDFPKKQAAKQGMTIRTCACCCLVAMAAPLASCASHDTSGPVIPVKSNYMRFQLIVKFKSTLVPSVDASFVERLSQETGIGLVVVRAMSGDAYILAVAEPLSTAEREALLRRLRARTDVEYVNEDRLMRPMSR